MDSDGHDDSEEEEEMDSDGHNDSEDEKNMFELQRQTNRRRQRAMRFGRSRTNRIFRRALLQRMREQRRIRGL